MWRFSLTKYLYIVAHWSAQYWILLRSTLNQIALCAALQEDIRSTADIDLGLGKEDTREIGNQPPSRIMSAACATGAIQVKRTITRWNFEEFKLNSFLLLILMSVLKKVRKFIIFGCDQNGRSLVVVVTHKLWGHPELLEGKLEKFPPSISAPTNLWWAGRARVTVRCTSHCALRLLFCVPGPGRCRLS